MTLKTEFEKMAREIVKIHTDYPRKGCTVDFNKNYEDMIKEITNSLTLSHQRGFQEGVEASAKIAEKSTPYSAI